MSGISKSGFSLIELMVAIALIALLATVVIPNIGKSSKYDREKFIRDLNALSILAWQKATIAQKIHKVDFDIKNNKASLQVETDKRDDKGEPIFEPVKGAYVVSSIAWPKHIEIKNFFIEGFDEITKYRAGSASQIWYFIYPEGRTQTVTINFVDTKDRLFDKPRQIGLVLNPFSGQFKEYDSFQK